MPLFSHISVHGFINSNAISIDTFIYTLVDKVILGEVQVRHHEFNNLFKHLQCFKPIARNSKYVVICGS